MKPEIKEFMDALKARTPGEAEFHQAVQEVIETVWDTYQANPKYKANKILEKMVEPERVIMFRVPWIDDKGEVQINRGYRVQFNSAIGPYKGGLRFHPSVTLGGLKFLGFEQTFKNSLTTLPMGGGKGGSDFNPKGKSDNEVMRFCQSFMTELCKHIGPNTDVPAGDIGVGAREIGYLFGQYKRIRNEFTGVLTGKNREFGGSRVRPEATGYGTVYFAQHMLAEKGEKIAGKTVAISGFGNVAWGAAQKLVQLGAKLVTISGPDGYIYAENGIRTVVLKGFAVSRLYPRPEHRPCGDLDCFLGAGYERGNTLAAAAGAKVDADYYKHSHIVFRGLTVENHRFCTAIRGSRQAKAFERHLQSILASQPCPPILGTDLLAPPADFNALFLTKHALLHFLTEGISLRHLCDWALFVDRQGEQVDWPEFRRVAAEHGLLRFAGVMTRLAVRLLGVKEDVFPVDAALDPLADRVLNNMLYERRHLNDTAGNVWVKRFRMVAGIWHDRWKYRDIYQRSVCREIFRFMSGFLVERKPEI